MAKEPSKLSKQLFVEEGQVMAIVPFHQQTASWWSDHQPPTASYQTTLNGHLKTLVISLVFLLIVR
jgi:hypothetical protein